MDELECALVTLKQDYHILKNNVADLVNVNEGHNQDVANLAHSKGLQDEWREKKVASEGEESTKESNNSSHEPDKKLIINPVFLYIMT